MRRRARHRLIGASVLVLLGVVGFPLLFDTQPRPISVDIPIEIPAKSTPAPAVKQPGTAAAPAAAPASAKPPAPSVEARETLSAREEVVEAATPPKAAVEPAKAAPVPAPADAERARALLEGKTATPPATTAAAAAAAAAAPATVAAVAERLVVQVGAFSEEAGARSVRQKLEAAGLKTYTHVAETSEGRRIRVRLGPYNSRAEADKAAARVKALGLPAAVLTL